MHTLELDQAQKAWSQRRGLVEKTLEIDGKIVAAADSVEKLLEQQAAVEKEQAKTFQEQQAIHQEIAENDNSEQSRMRYPWHG